jgi:hypothetical protein
MLSQLYIAGLTPGSLLGSKSGVEIALKLLDKGNQPSLHL